MFLCLQLGMMKLGRQTCSMVIELCCLHMLCAIQKLNIYCLSCYQCFLILSAIQFVISHHELQKAGPHMNLVKLLHSSAGVRVKSAYVEIVVDNKGKSLRVRYILCQAVFFNLFHKYFYFYFFFAGRR